MPKLFISFDIETDFNRKLLNIGWCSSNIHDEGKEFFVWQNKKNLYWPNDVDPKYIGICQVWEHAQKTPLGEILTQFKKDVENKVIVGWNIKSFDIPILRKYFKKVLKYDWQPVFFDGLLVMRKLIKENDKLCKKLMKVNGLTESGKFPRLTAESMYKYFTGCFGYNEWHTALYDAQDERHIIKTMSQIGISPFKLSEKYIPKKD